MIDALILNHDEYPDRWLPFEVLEDNSVVFDERLLAELEKPNNSDLLDWAHKHIVELFT
jgi:hypothetical protein